MSPRTDVCASSEEHAAMQTTTEISTYCDHALAALEELAVAIRCLRRDGHSDAARDLQHARTDLAETLQAIGAATWRPAAA